MSKKLTQFFEVVIHFIPGDHEQIPLFSYGGIPLSSAKAPAEYYKNNTKIIKKKYHAPRALSFRLSTTPLRHKEASVTETHAFPRFGHPLPKSLVIWASPVTLTLTQTAKVLLEEDAHITRVLGNGDAQNVGMKHLKHLFGKARWGSLCAKNFQKFVTRLLSIHSVFHIP